MFSCVLSSGSRGNSTLIGNENTKILIDLGTTCLYVQNNLKELNIEPVNIDGIVITHTHIDHVGGLKVFLKKYNTKVYLSKEMKDSINFDIENYQIIEDDFLINDIKFKILKASHDTPCFNYIISCNNKSLGYITDTGYIHVKYHELLSNMDSYIMESNHDHQLLLNGDYPHHLKQRIIGDYGHLSNKDSSYYLSKFIGDKTKKVFLIHLSKDNNTPSKAINTLNETLFNKNISFDNIEISIQNQRTEVFYD